MALPWLANSPKMVVPTSLLLTTPTKTWPRRCWHQFVSYVSPQIKTCAFAADLSDPDFGPKVVEQALAGLAREQINIVISNAAPNANNAVVEAESMTKKDFDFHMTGSAWASLSLAKAAIRHIPRQGRIAMISSVASRFAFVERTITYSAAKAAVDSISKNLAAIWGVKYGITVNTISVEGTFTDAMGEAIKDRVVELEKMVCDLSFLKRIGEVDEVAEIVAFVASPPSGWIIGKPETNARYRNAVLSTDMDE